MGGVAPTTTDANLLKGRINPSNFLGGDVKADMPAVHRAFEKLGASLGLDAQKAAAGIIRVANSNMINALKLVSLNRGYDPRDFTLVAFGGGGGMHAVSLAAELNIPRVVIPMNCAVFAAWGMLMSDLRRDYVLTLNCDLTDDSLRKISDACEALERQAKEDFAQDGVTSSALRIERFGDMRYAGQEHTVRAEFPGGYVDRMAIAGAAQAFTNEYQRQYQYALPNTVQLVNLHIVALGDVGHPSTRKLPVTGRRPVDATKARRQVDFDDDGWLEISIYDRALLEPEMQFIGPAIIEEPDTTIVVPPTHGVQIDAFGNIHITSVSA
jgi:N-methylhydantoinase A